MDDFIDATFLLEAKYYVYALYYRDRLQYVGLSTAIQTRINSHKTAKKFMFDRVMIKLCDNRRDMEALEFELIAKHRPPFNTFQGYATEPVRIDLKALGIDVTRYLPRE